MKNKRNYLKAAFIDGSIMLTMFFGLASCSNSSKPDDTKDVAEDHNEAKFEDKKSEDNAQFLVDAAEINLMEIQLGNLAMERGSSADVKDLGKMMADAHSKTLDDLKSLASKKSVSIPVAMTDDGQSAYKKLSDKSGKDFDKDFCDMMVDGHKEAITKFEKASQDSTDADIQQWASATLPALRDHLDHALACQEKCKKM